MNRRQPYAFPSLHYRPTEMKFHFMRFNNQNNQAFLLLLTFSVLQSKIVSLRKVKFCKAAADNLSSFLMVRSTPPDDDDGSNEFMTIFI